MKDTLIICNTYYQVIMATHLANGLLKDSKVSLVISDHSKNAELYSKNAEKLTCFEKVYYSETKSLVYGKKNLLDKLKLFCGALLKLLRGHNIVYDAKSLSEVFIYNNDLACELPEIFSLDKKSL